jgi:hypothetical protein
LLIWANKPASRPRGAAKSSQEEFVQICAESTTFIDVRRCVSDGTQEIKIRKLLISLVGPAGLEPATRPL